MLRQTPFTRSEPGGHGRRQNGKTPIVPSGHGMRTQCPPSRRMLFGHLMDGGGIGTPITGGGGGGTVTSGGGGDGGGGTCVFRGGGTQLRPFHVSGGVQTQTPLLKHLRGRDESSIGGAGAGPTSIGAGGVLCGGGGFCGGGAQEMFLILPLVAHAHLPSFRTSPCFAQSGTQTELTRFSPGAHGTLQQTVLPSVTRSSQGGQSHSPSLLRTRPG